MIIKLKYILLLFCFLQMTNVFAKDKFDVANENFKKGNYKDAIFIYESILESNKHSPELYFNLANCYYKLNQIAPAIYFFEKAKILNPKDTRIDTNLKFAQNRTLDQFETVPKLGYGALFHKITCIYHYNTWAYIAVFCSFLLLLFYFLYDYSQSSIFKRVFFVMILISFIFTILFIAFAFFEKSNYENDQPAIVFDKVVEVKTEPKSNGAKAFEMHEGTKVYVIEQKDNWRKIYINNENIGWIKASNIKMLK